MRRQRNPFDAYHGTAARFSKFSPRKLSRGASRSQHGWGVYLTSDVEVARSYARSRGVPTQRTVQVHVDADADQFLIWDAPYDEQPGRVQRALQRLATKASAPGRLLKSMFKDMENGDTGPGGWHGRQFYSVLHDAFTDDGRRINDEANRQVSQWLAKGGIVGAVFADHTDAQDGTATNFVVFDLSKLRIDGEAL
jgi:hypothetical protein